MNCSHVSCPGEGKWYPVILFRKRKTDKPRTLRFKELQFCELHKDQSTIESFICKEGWVKIENFLKERMQEVPSKNLSLLEWDKVQNRPKDK